MAQKSEKNPGEPQNEGSLPSLQASTGPGKHPQGRASPGKVTAQGRAFPGKRGMLQNKSTLPGVWRRQALLSRENFSRPSKKAEGKDGKEGKKEGRRHPDKLLQVFQRNWLSMVGRRLPGTQKGRKKLCHDWEEKCQKPSGEELTTQREE